MNESDMMYKNENKNSYGFELTTRDVAKEKKINFNLNLNSSKNNNMKERNIK